MRPAAVRYRFPREGPDCAAGRSLAKMPVEQRDAVSCARKGRGVDSLAFREKRVLWDPERPGVPGKTRGWGGVLTTRQGVIGA